MRCVGSKIVEIDGAFRDDRGPTSVSARNPLKYTGPFLFTPYTRIETGDSLVAAGGGRESEKKKKKKKRHRRKTIHSDYEILIKLLRLFFFQRFGWMCAHLFLPWGFREKISSYLILLHGRREGMLRSRC